MEKAQVWDSPVVDFGWHPGQAHTQGTKENAGGGALHLFTSEQLQLFHVDWTPLLFL